MAMDFESIMNAVFTGFKFFLVLILIGILAGVVYGLWSILGVIHPILGMVGAVLGGISILWVYGKVIMNKSVQKFIGI